MSAGKQAIKRITERLGGGEEGKPHSTRTGRIAAGTQKLKRFLGKPRPQAGRPESPGPKSKRPWAGTPPGRKRTWAPPKGKFPPEKRKSKPPIGKFPPEKGKWQKVAEGGRIGFKKGTDKKWMQKVSASIKKRGTKGKCTPITKPGCTGRAKALEIGRAHV